MYNYYQHLLTYLIIKRKKVLDVLSLNKKTKCNVFVILCEPRSGSTLLHTYLNSHPQIMSHGETLREKIEQELPENSISNFLTRSILDFKSSTVKTVGLKLFYAYYKDQAYHKYFTFFLQRKDVQIIHLIRRDTLRLFTSLKIAQKTNVWSTARTPHVREKIAVDGNEYLMFKNEYANHQQEFDALFKDHRVLKISYEDLVDKPNQILETVQLFLDVKPKHLFTLLKKQNPDSLESIILNYNDVKRLFES